MFYLLDFKDRKVAVNTSLIESVFTEPKFINGQYCWHGVVARMTSDKLNTLSVHKTEEEADDMLCNIIQLFNKR